MVSRAKFKCVLELFCAIYSKHYGFYMLCEVPMGTRIGSAQSGIHRMIKGSGNLMVS